MNNLNTNQNYMYPQNASPNAVSINIISPQAYGSTPNCTQPIQTGNFYPMYGTNVNPSLPLYPANYNNMINTPYTQYQNSPMNAYGDTNLMEKTKNPTVEDKTETQETEKTEEKKDKNKKEKKITPLTNEYVQSLENYMNNDNPKIRLIAAKDLMERFKEIIDHFII